MQRYEPLNFDGGDGPRVDWDSGFRLDDQQIAFGLGRALSARLSDLLDIAMAAYVTDRLRPRRPSGSRGGDDWSRELPDAEAGGYRTDVREVVAPGDRRALRLHYMLNQAAQMDRALRDALPLDALVRTFPDLRRIHDALATQGFDDPVALTRTLLTSYAEEWAGFDHSLTPRYLPVGRYGGVAA